MEYSVEDVSPVKKKVTVKVEADEAAGAVMATTAMYKTKTDIKGFRKGKVPLSVVESKFKKQIYEEATTDLINVHLNEILSELSLRPLSGLEVDAGVMEKEEPFTYTFSFEVMPAFELPPFEGMEVEQEKPEISEEEVDSVIERVRENVATLENVDEDRKAQDGDVVLINFQGYKDGEAMEGIKAEHFELSLGAGQALAEFEDIVKKMKVGDTLKEVVSFPADFINEQMAGQDIEMEVHLEFIKKKVLPEIDDKLAADAGGFGSVEEMREAITKSYMQTRSQLARSTAQKKLLDDILKLVDFDLPEGMVEEQIAGKIKEKERRLESMGKRLEAEGQSLDDLKAEFRPEAEDLVKAQLILMKVAEAENMEVSPDEVEAYIQHTARESNEDYASLRAFYEQNNLMFAVRDKLMADKAMEHVYSRVTVKEVAREVVEAGE
jgi:trigger factor